MMGVRNLVISLFAFLIGCAGEINAPPTPTFHSEGYPEKLSDWGNLIAADGLLKLGYDVHPYDLATPLFSDYAMKLRTVTLPEGQLADYRQNDVFDFPVGTVITKTFYYNESGDGTVSYGTPGKLVDASLPLTGTRLVETRILAHRATGWVAIPYVWDEDQSDAYLKRTGAVIPLNIQHHDGRREAFAYVTPNQNQCAGCHAPNNTSRELSPIGPKARHLNKASTYHDGFNQLDYWRFAGLLRVTDDQAQSAPSNAVWVENHKDVSSARDLDARARAYLDANCSHCHNPKGPADTSGLNLEPDALGPALGLCKVAIAAGDGAGGRPYDIVPGHPDKSIFVFRMESTKPSEMMPELGRSLSHAEGVALIRNWIAAMDGNCT